MIRSLGLDFVTEVYLLNEGRGTVKEGEVDFFPTLIWRHRKENLKKCSLRGLEERSDLRFYTYPQQELPFEEGYVLLDFHGPLLSEKDRNNGLILVDGTWRYAEKMTAALPAPQQLPRRSLPKGLRTAYPRRQEDCENPEVGLASVEALYAAYVFLGRDPEGILDFYYWKDDFLEKNQQYFRRCL